MRKHWCEISFSCLVATNEQLWAFEPPLAEYRRQQDFITRFSFLSLLSELHGQIIVDNGDWFFGRCIWIEGKDIVESDENFPSRFE